jgi:molybdenum cofactor cytidylyltransferase
VQTVECLVPAAGRSERMGTWKLGLPFRGRTIVESVVATALEACSRVVLVAGFRAPELLSLFASEPRVEVVVNPEWELGMFSSIRRGAAGIRSRRFFICLADMPFIGADCYRALLSAEEAEAVIPVCDGRRGHPVLLDRALLAAIGAADPAAGSMREILRGRSVSEVPWDSSIHRDIDTREDYGPLPPSLTPPPSPFGG